MIETRDLAEQSEPFARASQVLQLPLRDLEAVRCERVEAVHLAGDQPNRLTVARVLRCLPRVTDPGKAELDVAGSRIEETLNRLLRGAGNLEITRHVVQEEILEDVGTGVAPPRLAGLSHFLDQPRVVARPLILGKEMLVRVHEGKRADLMTKIGLLLHRRLPSLSVSR